MRNRYLVCYDVSDQQRLARTHRKMLGYGDPVQYSVFLCELSKSELILMRGDVEEALNLSEDRVLIADMGPLDGADRLLYVGRDRPGSGREVAVIV